MARTVRYQVDVDASRARAGANVASRAISSLTRRVGALAAGYASLAGVRALTQAISKQAEFGASLVETAQAAGLTTTELQELRRAFAEDGAAVEQTDRALVRFNSILSRAAQGQAEYADSFIRLGIQIRDSEGNIRSVSDVFNDLARTVGDNNFAEVSADLSRLIGEEGLAQLTPALRRSAAEFQAARDRAADFGAVADEQSQSLKDLAQTLTDIRDRFDGAIANALDAEAIGEAASRIANDLLPELVQLIEFVNDAARAWNVFHEAISEGAANARNDMALLVGAARDVSESTADMAANTTNFLVGFRQVADVVPEVVDEFELLVQKQIEAIRGQMELSAASDEARLRLGLETRELRAQREERERQLEQIAQIRAEQELLAETLVRVNAMRAASAREATAEEQALAVAREQAFELQLTGTRDVQDAFEGAEEAAQALFNTIVSSGGDARRVLIGLVNVIGNVLIARIGTNTPGATA